MAQKGLAHSSVEQTAFLLLPLITSMVAIGILAFLSTGDAKSQKLWRLPIYAVFLMGLILFIGLWTPFNNFRDLQTVEATPQRISP